MTNPTKPTARERAERLMDGWDAAGYLGGGEGHSRNGKILMIEAQIKAAAQAAREEERALTIERERSPMECGHVVANAQHHTYVEMDGGWKATGCLACAREARAVEEAVQAARNSDAELHLLQIQELKGASARAIAEERNRLIKRSSVIEADALAACEARVRRECAEIARQHKHPKEHTPVCGELIAEAIKRGVKI